MHRTHRARLDDLDQEAAARGGGGRVAQHAHVQVLTAGRVEAVLCGERERKRENERGA